MRNALVVLVVVVALLVGADVGLRTVAESRVAGEMQQQLELPRPPDVELQGFPFLLHAFRRRFPQAELEITGIRASGLPVDRVDVVLEGVRFDSLSVLAGGEGSVSASEGSGTVRVTDDAITEYLEEQGLPLSVELLGREARVTGTVSLGPFEGEATAQGTLAVSDGTLEFRPDRIQVADGIEVPQGAMAFRLDLPEVMPGIVYEEVTVADGTASLSFHLRRAVLRL